MNTRFDIPIAAWLVAMTASLSTAPLFAQRDVDAANLALSANQQPIDEVGITEKIGDALPLDATFTDENGNTVTLGDYFKSGKPVAIQFVYYGCTSLCTASLSGLLTTLGDMTYLPGDEFTLVTVSFDPSEDAKLAGEKRENYLQALDRPGAERGWHFLVADEANIQRATQAAGFKFKYVEETQQFAHDAALIIATPDGHISQYLRGAYYDPKTFRLSLVEAANGKIGSLSDRFWVTLCGYSRTQGKYVVLAQTIMTGGGALTLLVLVAVLAWLHLHSNRNANNNKASATDGQLHTT